MSATEARHLPQQGETPRRTMVRTLRRRVVVVVAAALVVISIASVWGIRIVTDRHADRQVRVAAQSVVTWGTEEAGAMVIDSGRLASADATSTVVAFLDADGRVVAATTGPGVALSQLEQIAADTPDELTARAEVGGRTLLFTEVPLPAGTVFDDGRRHPVERALVGTGVEGSDRLVMTLALTAVGILTVALLVVAIIVTLVVTRTTRALSDLAERVDDGTLEGLDSSPAAEFAETDAISTALVRLDERRNRTEAQLRDFVADASHELRTPLTTIQGWAELHFQAADDPETTERAFASVVEETHRMRSLVDRLTLLARAEGQPAPAERVDLAEIARSAVEDATLLAPDHAVELDAPDEAIVAGDALALTQLVRNLVGNALVHSGDGSTVTMRLAQTPETTSLTVADNGRGMPPALRDRAFERFVTGDRRHGTGLGLPIVLAIARTHGGTAVLESEEGRGTAVTVSLPAARESAAGA